MKKRNKRELNKRIMRFLPAVIAVLALLVIALLLNRTVSYKLRETGSQYYAGAKAALAKGTKLRHDSDGTLFRHVNGDAHEMNNLPIYYESEPTLVLPTSMVYYAPREGICARADYFTEVTCESTGMVWFTRENKELNLKPGFLYNGEELYVFLEPVEVSVNGYRIELPALSYIEAVYAGNIMIFNSETKEYFMESPTGSVTAVAGGGDYEISLLNDSMVSYDGTKTLLFTRPELLDPVTDRK